MAGITTHVLDTGTGRPAAGMRIDLSMSDEGVWRLVKTVHANADGRTDEMILPPAQTRVGHYEIVFHVADYFRAQGAALPDPPFVDQVPVRFSVSDPARHYHVPMLCSPWSCATYHGS